MANYAVLLRGVNVGGKNKLPMAELRSVLSSAGLENVQSYIQSGNILCQSSLSKNELAALCAKVLSTHFAIETPVFVIAESALRATRDANPFSGKEDLDKALQLYFLKQAACNANIEKLDTLKAESESFELRETCFYLYAPEGIGRSKLAAAAEKHLLVTTTTRNWRTVNKLLEMMP